MTARALTTTERVLAKAQEKGLVAMDANLPDEEIGDNIVFMAGFSTAEESDQRVSGRVVGMDVK